MAIAIEAYTVVVRNEAIVHRYPGGAEAFMMNVPNKTFCADQSLARVSFTDDTEADAFLEELESLGLSVSDGQDAVLCDAAELKVSPSCPWLCLGTYKDAAIAWITGENVRTVVGPRDWDPEKAGGRNIEADEAFREHRAKQEAATLIKIQEQAGQTIIDRAREPGMPVNPRHAVELQRAIEQLETVLDRAGDNWMLQFLLGKAWQALGRNDHASDAMARALSLAKGEKILARELCAMQLDQGWVDNAVRTAETAVGDDPLDPDLLGSLAEAYLMQGGLTAAHKTLITALKQKPDHEENLSLMGRLVEIQEGRRARPATLAELRQA